MEEKGLLIVISGPSGVGKGTIIKQIFKEQPNLTYSVSVTSRYPREGEVDGVNYFFIKPEKFLEMVENNEFLEWAKVYSNYYGTPRKFVEQALEQGKNVVLEIDIQGSLQVQKSFPQAVFIFILPPSLAELESRIRGRGTDEETQILERLGLVQDELKYLPYYDYGVVNDQLKLAVDKIKAIIIAEKCRISRNQRRANS